MALFSGPVQFASTKTTSQNATTKSGAALVMVWLGLAADDSEFAIRTFVTSIMRNPVLGSTTRGDNRNLYAGLESSLGAKVVRAKQPSSNPTWAPDLPQLILQSSAQKCKDPRDVFALLGIPLSVAVWREQKAEGFRVDYSGSAEQVYSDVFRYFGSTLEPAAMEEFSTKLVVILGVQSSHEVVNGAYLWTKGFAANAELL
ncbi:uncharacterized protein BDZ99DRAFT_518605 [Mytilinidion resinicola]|uniref:Uncharacterized protein n=1 Tax=Mytilinidion resinicola TaxID=574789 RepID=A0A6A6YSH6_9PEZI|nr:uncharacterized protein BDZ99DRAFT_518605 [Mytilinidion resinicola]KAF2811323.1 hypothetical protein BDZ99DRAFT_518605 [Mytilinidion resinicola]